MGDGDFDGETVSNAVLVKQPMAQVVVPPHKRAVYSKAGDTQRGGPMCHCSARSDRLAKAT